MISSNTATCTSRRNALAWDDHVAWMAEDRLIYRIGDDTIYIIGCKGHYE